jgi:hypothetical protein
MLCRVRETLNRKLLLHYCPEQIVMIELENLWAVEPNVLSTGAGRHKTKAGRNLPYF